MSHLLTFAGWATGTAVVAGLVFGLMRHRLRRVERALVQRQRHYANLSADYDREHDGRMAAEAAARAATAARRRAEAELASVRMEVINRDKLVRHLGAELARERATPKRGAI